MYIAVDAIEPDPHQPRKAFSHTANNDLVADIRRRGLQQPLRVRPTNLSAPAKPYRIVAGERRWRACQFLHLVESAARFAELPCIVTLSAEEDVLFAQLTENLLREDLTVLEECRHLRRIQVEFRLTAIDIAEQLNATAEGGGARTPEWVAQRLWIAEHLAEEAVTILQDWDKSAVGDPTASEMADASFEDRRGGRPSFALIRALAGAPQEAQAQIARDSWLNGLTSRQVDDLIRRTQEQSPVADTTLRRRGRRRAGPFAVRPVSREELAVDLQPLTIHSGQDEHIIHRRLGSIGMLNLVRLVKAAERRGGRVDLEEFIEDAATALEADRGAIAQLSPSVPDLDG